MLDEVERKINSRVGQFLYGYDNTSLVAELMKRLKEKKVNDSSSRELNRWLVSTGTN